MNLIKTPDEIALMRKAGKIVKRTLSLMEAMATPGTNLLDLSATAANTIKHLGGVPACLGYRGFPAPICISVNEEVLHGIPSSRVLKDGDLISFDLVVSVDGMHADSARTVQVGKKTEQGTLLIAAADEALVEAVKEVREGTLVLSLSSVIWQVLHKHGYKPVRHMGGHGIGHEMHEEPFISNNPVDGGMKGLFELKSGMVIAIEPTACAGSDEIELGQDRWTLSTKDGGLSAHAEHTILVKKDGYEVLT